MGGVVSAVSSVVSFTILGWLTKPKKQKDTVQRIGELSEQTAKEGEPRPIVWGRVRPIGGNIMHMSAPRIERREVKGESRGGKGGKKKQPKQYEERVFRTYAIRICEGPVTAIVRVWRNNKLVYDARGNEWGATNNGVFLKLAWFYLGGWVQMPDPHLESLWGAGEVPGYRGTCYMVVGNEDLTDLGGTVPQYTFEVERAEGVALTSRPYALENFDYSEAAPASVRASPEYVWAEGTDAAAASITSGELRATFKEYKLWPAEATEAGAATITAGSFVSTLQRYENYPAEATDAVPATIQSGTLKATLIKYEKYPAEATDAAPASIVGGSLV
jgi:hypothetical protein